MRLPTLTPRQILIVLHDLAATAIAIVATFYIRFETPGLVERQHALVLIVPILVVYAGVVYYIFGLYKAKWRFASLPDLINIFRAVTVLAVSLLVVDYVLVTPGFYGTFFFGKITILLYWFLQMSFLGGPRLAYRSFRHWRTQQRSSISDSAPILILGRAADAEIMLRSIESGAVKKVRPVGILSPSAADQRQSVRAIPVLGTFAALTETVQDLAERGITVSRIVLTPSAFDPDAKPETVLMAARRMGITVSRLPALDGLEAPRLAPVAVEDLLLRPSAKIDYARLEDFIRDKTVLVTGGGGSIGSEICDRVVTFGAAKLIIIENSEPALHAVLEVLAAKSLPTAVIGRLGDVRDRDRIFRLCDEFRPDIVFHAAALKHVPLLEQDWAEGVKTNVFGSVNVADAAVASGASAMVMISTDKAIEPVSVLGATKRFAEMYCQALDTDTSKRAVGGMRLIAVRFGNVLASNGSVVPKFKAQIEAGGPVTVTHRDMVRYFMTIREACDLVITAADHALGKQSSEVSVYVLNMGQPVKIVDLAERIIRLSGLEPGHDIEIAFTGMRPGERLHEILFASEENSTKIGIPGIVAAHPMRVSLQQMAGWLKEIKEGTTNERKSEVFLTLQKAVRDFAIGSSAEAKTNLGGN